MSLSDHIRIWPNAVLYSYTQVFFSKNRVFGILLILTTFLDPLTGISGLLSVVFANIFALVLGFNREFVEDGSYGFNNLLVGLGLGIYYEPGFAFYFLLVIASLITVLMTVSISGVLFKYRLPYLSIPFLLSIWSVLLASRSFTELGISQRGIFLLNELYATGDVWLIETYNYLNQLPVTESLKIYFKSLGAIFFQFNMLSGVLIAIGILFTSRISFTLSLFSFYAAYAFYNFIGADITELSYSYIGFNFILSGIAIGGFFIVPSAWSYLWTLILVPVLVILTSSFANLFSIIQLGVYSLPFNAVVITFLYVIKLRPRTAMLKEVQTQQFSPEKHVYDYRSNTRRFRNFREISIGLPVKGSWYITQAHNGEITHQSDWRHAWDFVIRDNEGSEHVLEGRQPTQYYCYDKPVIAVAPGTVEQVIDHVEENDIGDMNLKQNWGNSVVVNHGGGIFSQVSHLKAGSVQVNKGEYVHRGTILGKCGNSGRSPTPHVHFQLQESPQVGSRTLKYPLSHYMVEEQGGVTFRFYDYPEKGERVGNVAVTPALKDAFHFYPGKKLKLGVEETGEEVIWEVEIDVFNNQFIRCRKSGDKAYFKNDGQLFYFTGYSGSKRSLLYYFYLGTYKVLLGCYEGLYIEDDFPLYDFRYHPGRYLQDFLAPFAQFSNGNFFLEYEADHYDMEPGDLTIRSSAILRSFGKRIREYEFSVRIEGGMITNFSVYRDGAKISASCSDFH